MPAMFGKPVNQVVAQTSVLAFTAGVDKLNGTIDHSHSQILHTNLTLNIAVP